MSRDRGQPFVTGEHHAGAGSHYSTGQKRADDGIARRNGVLGNRLARG